VFAHRYLEVKGGRNLVDSQGAAHGAAHHGVYPTLVVELDLGLGGMHVDVDALWVQFEKEHVGRVLVARN
jgi:hypothetical protein